MSHFEIEAEGLRVSRRFLEGCWASCGAMRGGAVPPILRQDLTRHFGYDWGYASSGCQCPGVWLSARRRHWQELVNLTAPAPNPVPDKAWR